MASEAPEAPTPAAPLRALVVDDDKNIRATLAVCLEGIGCAVRTDASAATALSALAEAPSSSPSSTSGSTPRAASTCCRACSPSARASRWWWW
jgi:hypothetical protein